ncbi:pentatricopeptide repeat-containing protein, putative [Ricinus communis]|uniref:Pentatricopeptide repeat-containing protein, putative n=1 Tax=Ricinus communis TaxID=3988 RepID=B9S3G0_RICCO|nr:pentatricopeptide repeat-containing protein, putative [Ricinus communis]
MVCNSMSLRFFTSQLWCNLQRAFKPTNHLLSRAYHIASNPEQDYLYQYYQTFDSDLFAHLLRNGSFSNPYFINKVVSFCAKFASYDLGIQLHSTIIRMGFTSNVHICSAVVDMYAKCSEIQSAHEVFNEMPERNDVTWNSLIFGYLNVMPTCAMRGVTSFSVSTCLVVCSQLEVRNFGAQVHGLSLKLGFDNNVFVGTALIDMYSKCDGVDDSWRVFDYMVDKNVVTWTAMVTAYAQNEQPDEAMILVREMMRLGIKANYVTYNSLLSSFSGPKYMQYCKQVHCSIIRCGLECNLYIAATLVTVYSKCTNNLEDFNKISSGVQLSDQISWNAVIAGYSNLGLGEDALKCFCEMRHANIKMDFYTFTSLLGAIGAFLAIEEGREMHALIVKTGYASSVYVQNGLVSMYARCGAIDDSKRVFWLMEDHDVVSWNALLTGCAHHGFGNEAVELFEQMRKTKIKPNSTTFLAVLSACSHVGSVDKGLEYFDFMRSDISLEPLRVEHYASVVDIFGRAGYLSEAEAIINCMPMDPGPSVYKALLSACLVHGNREIAVRSARKLLELWPDDPATYILLSNMLATEGYWDDAADVRKLMCDRGVRKNPGYSWI